MSWSINYIGHPDSIVDAIEKESDRLEGQSKVEFDAVKNMLACLVRQNFSNTGPIPILHLNAHGHAYTNHEGVPAYGNCTVNLQPLHGILV